MSQVKSLLLGSALCGAALTGTAAAEWQKSYVIEWYEPAHYYGAETGVIDPGTDCPAGTNPERDWIAILSKAGYTEEEARWLRDPIHPYRVPSHGQNQMAFRGEGRANVYTKPWTTPDPGLTPVSGTVAEGFNLDGDTGTGFDGLSGEKGIDNEFYRAMGCWKTYRGPKRLASGAMNFNDAMREGSWTVAIVVSGEGDDPYNDDDVTVAFYDSKDPLVKDGNGDIARDYTFTVAPNVRYEAIFDAKTVNGEITTVAPSDEIWMRDPSYTRELQLLEAQLHLSMNEDGTLTGHVGGYRPWEEVYRGWVDARGSVIEQLTWVELPSVWYSLKRHADYSPKDADGEKTHISYAMRIDAVPAFVMVPDASDQVLAARSYKGEAPVGQKPVKGGLPFRVVDGIVPDKDGVLLAGPTAEIIPPTLTRAEVKAQRAGAIAGGQ